MFISVDEKIINSKFEMTKIQKKLTGLINTNKTEISTKCSKNMLDNIKKELNSFVKVQKFNNIIDYLEPLTCELKKNLEI